MPMDLPEPPGGSQGGSGPPHSARPALATVGHLQPSRAAWEQGKDSAAFRRRQQPDNALEKWSESGLLS